jgi:hypothetical protein
VSVIQAPTGDTPPIEPPSHFDLFHDEPPPLNYTVKDNNRERTIIIWITLLFLEAGVLPLILFYALKWGAHLSYTTNLAIITSLIGAVSGFKVGTRQWYLWLGKDHHTRRPIGAGRWGMDMLQTILSLCMGAFFIPLIIGSSVHPANPRIVSMSLPLVMCVLCFPLLVTGLFPHKLRIPFRISSLPAWKPIPPFAYFFVEDVIAVDGGGCTEFRQAWRIRYEESHLMRHHLRAVSLMYGISGGLVAAALLTTAWVAPTDTEYGLCWSMPWLWAMITGTTNIVWTNRMLARERADWSWSPTIHRERTLPIVEGKYDPPAIAPETLARRSTSIARMSESRRQEIHAVAQAANAEAQASRAQSQDSPLSSPRRGVIVQEPKREEFGREGKESEKSAV